MASQYNVEPQPTAKVILNTTAGDITLELFGKQTPLATQNFLQHCLDGYYDNTLFHRLVPNFIIQGGDPTGTGSGGISAVNNGDSFQDEFHSRLKFNRRGLIGMANEGPDSNGSQFFFTLAATPELQGKNTMFGRVEGDTIYNLMKMADAEIVDGSDRPMYPSKITGTEILVNPYPGMVARAKVADRTKVNDKDKQSKKRKKPLGKNILSFDDDGDVASVIPVSKKAKVNPKMMAAPVESTDEVVSVEAENAVQDFWPITNATNEQTEEVKEVSKEVSQEVEEIKSSRTSNNVVPEDEDAAMQNEDASRRAAIEKTNAEIAALKASMRRTNAIEEKPKERPKTVLESMIPAKSTRGRKRGKATEDSSAMDLFNAFKQKLEDLPRQAGVSDQATNGAKHVDEPNEVTHEDDEEAGLCDLHFIVNCQSCKSWDDDDKPDHEAEADGRDDPGWMAHQLTFAKDTLGKDLEWKKKMEEIEIIDPREKARTLQEESRKEKLKKRR